MAAGNWIPYTQAIVNTHKALIDWSSANIRMVLLSNSYTPAQDTDATWANLSTYQISGTGYTAGGVAVTTPTVTNSGGTTTAAGGTSSWSASTLTAKYAALVLSTGGATINSTDKVLAYVALDTSTTVSTTAGTLSVSGYSVGITHNAS